MAQCECIDCMLVSCFFSTDISMLGNRRSDICLRGSQNQGVQLVPIYIYIYMYVYI